MRLSQAIELFFLDVQARKLTKSTLQFYHWRLNASLKQIGDKEMVDITVYDLRAVVAATSELSAVHAYRALKRFCRFLFDEGLTPVDVAEKLVRPKAPKSEVMPIPHDAVQQVLRAAAALPGFIGIRDAAIVATFYGTGIRRAELCGLKDQDVDLRAGLMRIYGKGRKERIIPLPVKLRKILMRYTFERERTKEYASGDCPYFFRDRDGRALTPNALTLVMKRLKDRSGVDVRAHRPRHSFCTAFMANHGADVLILKELAGWSTLTMATRYAKPSMKKLAESLEAFSPINDL